MSKFGQSRIFTLSGGSTADPTPGSGTTIKYYVDAVEDYGLTPDSEAAAASNVTALTSAMSAAGQNKFVYIPYGNYYISSQVTWSARAVIGHHAWRINDRATRFIATSGFSGSSMFHSQNNACQMANIVFDCNNYAGIGLSMDTCNTRVTEVENVTVNNATVKGFHIVNCQLANFTRLKADNCAISFHFDGCNGSVVDTCHSTDSTSHGFYVTRGGFAGTMELRSCGVENAGGHAMYFLGDAAVNGQYLSLPTITGLSWIEGYGPGYDGVHMKWVNCGNVTGLRISGGNSSTADSRALRLVESRMVMVYRCFAARTNYDGQMTFRDESGTSNDINNGTNWRISQLVANNVTIEVV